MASAYSKFLTMVWALKSRKEIILSLSIETVLFFAFKRRGFRTFEELKVLANRRDLVAFYLSPHSTLESSSSISDMGS